MKFGVVICSNDPETVWNALRLGLFAARKGDGVKAFLVGKGVEAPSLNTEAFNVPEQLLALADAGGEILACGTCLKLRQAEGSELCPVATMQDLYDLISECDRTIAF